MTTSFRTPYSSKSGLGYECYTWPSVYVQSGVTAYVYQCTRGARGKGVHVYMDGLLVGPYATV